MIALNELTEARKLLALMDERHEKIAYITNADDQLIGCVSQGDIIRLLLGGGSLRISAKDFCSPSPLRIVESSDAFEQCRMIILKNGIHSVPIVDINNKIIRVVTVWDFLV
jgi:CBS domain-containing protein